MKNASKKSEVVLEVDPKKAELSESRNPNKYKGFRVPMGKTAKGILSPLRLPIPTHRLVSVLIIIQLSQIFKSFLLFYNKLSLLNLREFVLPVKIRYIA